MAIYLPSIAEEEQITLDELTPREIVAELDKYVIGQKDAKRAVAIALRNRMRRQKLPSDMAEEVIPKNIIMIGPTGVGKTEIARRLAKLANSPFLKVEASKFTEVGYVGRDVESMIRDLVEIAIEMVRNEKLQEVADKRKPMPKSGFWTYCFHRCRCPAGHPTIATGRQLNSGTARGKNCALSCGKANSTSAWSKSRSRNATFPHSRSSAIRASRKWISTSKISFPVFWDSAPRSER